MFIGHYAPAFAAAASRRSPRLGWLFVAAQLVDIAFFSFVLLDIEHLRMVPHFGGSNAMDLYDMPWTHSLLGAAGWAAGFALVIRLVGGSWRAAAIGAAVVVSHWLLDLLVHVPDLTLAGSPPKLGLGLWRHPAIEHPLELVLAFGVLGFYAWRTRARNVVGHVALGFLAAVMLVVQTIDWTSPQPVQVIDPIPASRALTALAAYAVMTAIAWWAGHVREPR